jgi:hypothetical protein
MSRDEVITTSSTGAKKAGNLQRVGLIPPQQLLEIGEHFGIGALKYDEWNWALGMPWDKLYNAMLRHLLAFLNGEDYDLCTCEPQTTERKCPDCGATGSKHIIAVAWHAICLSYYMDHYPELDTRLHKAISQLREKLRNDGS